MKDHEPDDAQIWIHMKLPHEVHVATTMNIFTPEIEWMLKRQGLLLFP